MQHSIPTTILSQKHNLDIKRKTWLILMCSFLVQVYSLKLTLYHMNIELYLPTKIVVTKSKSV